MTAQPSSTERLRLDAAAVAERHRRLLENLTRVDQRRLLVVLSAAG